MTTFVSELEPRDLWIHFDRILAISRGSGQEQQMAAYVLDLARRLGLETRQDGTGNVVVRKPAKGGRSDAPITVLQCHLDMVNEKNSDVDHDFSTDPIRPRRDGDYLKATGTTLGADNGIGVATCLALMEDSETPHGPLEFLFTIDEETGLTGAAQLEGDLLEGRLLLNLDCEEEEALYVGCAGGSGLDFNLQLDHAATGPDQSALSVELRGLQGGHSGVDIHLQRGNAVALLARLLESALQVIPFHLSEFLGGSAHNAIPREARAVVVCSESDRQTLSTVIENDLATIGKEFRAIEPQVSWKIDSAQLPEESWSDHSTRRFLDLLNSLPHGVISRSYDIPDLVETSASLASAHATDGEAEIHVSTRSSVKSALQALQLRLKAIGNLAGCRTRELESYPGWQPDLSSPLLATTREVYRDETGKDPEVKAIHAGLECGLIGEKYPGMDMISLGPQIEFPHSPDERVMISSVGRFYRILKSLLVALSDDSP